MQTPDLAGKRIELLRELLSGARRIAADIVFASSKLAMEEVEQVASRLSIEVNRVEVHDVDEVARAQASPVIGFLHAGAPEENEKRLAAFRKGLGAGGYVEGQNVKI